MQKPVLSILILISYFKEILTVANPWQPKSKGFAGGAAEGRVIDKGAAEGRVIDRELRKEDYRQGAAEGRVMDRGAAEGRVIDKVMPYIPVVSDFVVIIQSYFLEELICDFLPQWTFISIEH